MTLADYLPHLEPGGRNETDTDSQQWNFMQTIFFSRKIHFTANYDIYSFLSVAYIFRIETQKNV